MGFKEQAIIFKVNEYLKKPEIRKLLVGKIIDASKDPEFKEFVREDVEEVLKEGPHAASPSRVPAKAKEAAAIKKAVSDKDAVKKAARDVLKELEKDTELKERHKPLGHKFIETILQSKILDFRLNNLYLKQQGFAWVSSITVICFILAIATRLNNNLHMSRIFLGIGTVLAAGGFLTYYFFARTYNEIFAK